MRFMILLKADGDFGFPPEELFDAIGELGLQAMGSGALVTAGGLMPPRHAAQVALADGEITVNTGLEQPAGEAVVAYSIYDVRSLPEAVDETRRFLEIHREHWPTWNGRAEIRQIFSTA